MKKIFILVISLTLQCAGGSDKIIADHAKAFAAFEPCYKSISYLTWNAGDYKYHNWLGSESALIEFIKYDACRNTLDFMVTLNSCKNGSIIGLLGAIINKWRGSDVDWKTCLGITLSSMAAEYYQNDKYGNIPYINRSMQKKDCFMTQMAVSRVLASLISAAVSYWAVRYMLDYASGDSTKNDLSDKQEDSLKPLLEKQL